MFAALDEETISTGSVSLTAEEQAECQSFLRSVLNAKDYTRGMKKDLADSFKRGITAACMMGRARRFLLQAAASSSAEMSTAWGHDEPDYGEKAYQAASKACAIFPISMNFYDFGCLLQELGRHGKARMVFMEFLDRVKSRDLDPIEKASMSKRNIEGAIAHARMSI
jgi:hypothetical protein